MKSTICRGLLPIMVLTLGGCLSTNAPPSVAVPSPAIPAAFTQGSLTTDRTLPDRWWQLFEDERLDALVESSLRANADLRVAFANLQGVRAALRQANAARLPQPILESSGAIDNPSGQPSAANVSASDYDVAATISWDIDLFGRLRSAALAAHADAQGQAAALDGVRVAVAADTVLAYVDLCGATRNGAIARSIVAVQERNLRAMREQYAAGEVSPLEVAQAASLLETSRAQVPLFDAGRANALYRLATLQGLAPTDTRMPMVNCVAIPHLTADLPTGDGAAFLARRPDLREAERKLESATAKIGIARADLYPRVNLGGALGLLAGAFSATASPLISWSFPNQAPVRAKIAQAEAGQQAALAGFDSAVLRALREVESGLASLRGEYVRNVALERAKEEAGHYVRRTNARVRIGDVSPLLAIDAERTRTAAELQKAQSDLSLAQSYVTLFRALGGGWQPMSQPLDPTKPIG